ASIPRCATAPPSIRKLPSTSKAAANSVFPTVVSDAYPLAEIDKMECRIRFGGAARAGAQPIECSPRDESVKLQTAVLPRRCRAAAGRRRRGAVIARDVGKHRRHLEQQLLAGRKQRHRLLLDQL